MCNGLPAALQKDPAALGPARPQTRRTIFVSKDGDDDADGLTPQTAKRSVQAAFSVSGPVRVETVPTGDF